MNVRPKIDKDRAAIMWSEDKTIGDIADFFGVSRNSVSGLMNRNRSLFPKKTDGAMDLNPNGQKGGAGRAWKERKPYTRINTQGIHKARKEAVRREAKAVEDETAEIPQIVPTEAERLNAAKELMDLGAHECRWPVNNGHPFMFCAAVTDGATYCQHHAERAYRPWRVA